MGSDSVATVPVIKRDRHLARQKLGLSEDDFIVCSFGLLGPHKLNDRLLSAWLASPLASNSRCRLVFVGQNHGGVYGKELVRTLLNSPIADRVEITGWVDTDHYRTWLTAADVGVQLRTHSRGETSAAVLDCMNYGLATVVNANGSMADLPANAVWMLPDEFTNDELAEALTALWQDTGHCHVLGECASEVIRSIHQPRRCAKQYAQTIEVFYQQASLKLHALIDAVADVEPALSGDDWPRLATALANNFLPRPRRKQLLLDISELIQRDSKSGIQRVVRALLMEFLTNPPDGWMVEPVYATSDNTGYRYARQFTSRFLGVNDSWAEDVLIDAWQGDIFLGLDLQHIIVAAQKNYLLGLNRRGIQIYFVVYDLLPVLLPQVFPDVAQAMHQRWLETISCFDGAVCISRAVTDQLYEWLQAFQHKRERCFTLDWFHLGADVENTVPTVGMPIEANHVLEEITARPSFLMVGTIEPRKGHAQTLAAFELLWSEGIHANLVIVGKLGWMVEPLIEKLRTHSEFGKRLFWLEGISDEYLGRVYASCTCLIAASEGEGFGLPLIEAAQHMLPIIARDIPVFREVASNHAFYFDNNNTPEVLAEAVRDWLSIYRNGDHPRSEALPWLTWKMSAKQLLDAVIDGNHYKIWLSDKILRFWGNDPRLHTQVGERLGRGMHTRGREGFLLYGPYTSLAAGCYCIVMNGHASQWTEREWIDIACDKGERRILHASLGGLSTGDWKYEAEFILETTATDLEFRLWVEKGSQLSVDGIELVPMTETRIESTATVKNTGKIPQEREKLCQL